MKAGVHGTLHKVLPQEENDRVSFRFGRSREPSRLLSALTCSHSVSSCAACAGLLSAASASRNDISTITRKSEDDALMSLTRNVLDRIAILDLFRSNSAQPKPDVSECPGQGALL